jgi:hypothetical protein
MPTARGIAEPPTPTESDADPPSTEEFQVNRPDWLRLGHVLRTIVRRARRGANVGSTPMELDSSRQTAQ